MKKPNGITFPTIIEIRSVDFDSRGFWSTDNSQNTIKWTDITEVALGYWIHNVAIVDFYFHSFRTTEENNSIWVIEGSHSFDQEIEKRFPHNKAPAMNEWIDENRCIRTFTLWPKEHFSEPMYLNRKQKWYSRMKLAFEKRAKPKW